MDEKVFRVSMLLLIAMFLTIFFCGKARGECPVMPRNTPVWVGVDKNCHLYRREMKDGVLFIKRLSPALKTISIEAVDCTQAKPNQDGHLYFYPQSIQYPVWCKEGTHERSVATEKRPHSSL